MISNDRKFFAYLDEMNIITILLPLSYHHGLSASFTLSSDHQNQSLEIIEKGQIENNYKYICNIEEEIYFEKSYWVIDEHEGKTDLQMGAVIRTDTFDEKFYYPDHDLGVICEEGQTQFKLWAPTATQVKLKLRPPNNSFSEIVKMKREDKGVWSTTIQRDLEYYHYTYLILVNQEWREAVDPYVNALTANGELGVVIKLGKLRTPKPFLPKINNPVDAIIYETHIRDFTIHPNSGVDHKGLYLGAGELNTKAKDGELTGLSYLKEIGITHIEFLPFHDFAGVNELERHKDYNWGYNPIHFNAPDGSYATDPTDPYCRILELKQLINQVHSVGIRVIMDVVYNHVYNRENSSFEKIVPGYYFRHNEYGLPSNGTGVGNDIASERKMVRKFIVDSIRFWMETYHIDGFRFDLMGILDVDTMAEVKTMCETLSDDTVLIGEGWNLNTPLSIEKKAIIRNQAKIPYISQFNDRFRDTIKGNTFNIFDKGYAFGNDHYYEAACEVLSGSIGFKKKENGLFNEPYQSVNYVECHDNHTMWDKLLSCHRDIDEAGRKKYHRLATSLVILSQGIPFLHSGQEFFRTKRGEGNSYRSPDSINQLDWDKRGKDMDNVNYIKGLIQIRKTFPCFRIRSAAEIRSNMKLLPLSPPLIGYSYQNQNSEFREVLLLINPLPNKQNIPLPEGEWWILVDHIEKKPAVKHVGKEITMESVCLNILVKK